MDQVQIAFIAAGAFVVAQRLVELQIARSNTRALLTRGGVEFGKSHYFVLVLLHASFFISLFAEAKLFGVRFNAFSPYFLAIFLMAQAGRIWVIRSLQGRWTTRIIVLPGKPLIRQGPFAAIPHPNYLVVAVELLTLPALFGLYRTAVLFSVLNAAVLLLIRIPQENQALQWATGKIEI